MSLPAEVLESMVLDEMFAAAAHGGSAAKLERWERAWKLCAGAYAREKRSADETRCEGFIVKLKSLCGVRS